MWIALWLACEDAEETPTSGTSIFTNSSPTGPPTGTIIVPTLSTTGTPCAWVEDCTDVTDTASVWTLEKGWSLISGVAIDDLTGDGAMDVWLDVRSPAGSRSDLILDGTVIEGLKLPSDAYASTGGFFTTIPDVSGDGAADAKLDTFLLAGPLPPGEIDPSSALGSVVGIIEEVDGDGIGDMIVDGSDAVSIWTGPYATPAGGPDLVVDPGCEPDGGEPLYGGLVPDVTGDGASELYLPGSFGYDSCGGWTLSAGFLGEVDPQVAPEVWSSSYLLTVFGDLDGDGARDVWTGSSVLLGPLVFGGPTLGFASEIPADVQALAGTLTRLPADLDQDGIGDLVLAEDDGARLTLTVLSGRIEEGVFGARRLARYGYRAADAVWLSAVVQVDGTDHLWLVFTAASGGPAVAADLGPVAPINSRD